MSDLDTVDKLENAFWRLVGTEADDPGLVVNNEDPTEVLYQCLTLGARNAQGWMIDMGYQGWRKRSTAITWSGADSTDGGRYVALPADYLKLNATQRKSPLVTAAGRRWGALVEVEEEHRYGNFMYVKGEELWLTRTAQPLSGLLIDYHYRHPVFTSTLADGDIDFPLMDRRLIVCEAAVEAMEENWLLGGPELMQKIERARIRSRESARKRARLTKEPRQMRKPPRFGARW